MRRNEEEKEESDNTHQLPWISFVTMREEYRSLVSNEDRTHAKANCMDEFET